MPKKLITEKDILDAVARGQQQLDVDKDTIFTPSAKDAIVRFKISIASKKNQAVSGENKTESETSYRHASIPSTVVGGDLIVIGSDHGGYAAKEMVKKYLNELRFRSLDIGTNSEEPCDYPDYAYAVAHVVAKGEAWKGIMIDATGVASSIVCNKVPGIRAVACYNEFVARSSREHNDANVLTLGAKSLGPEAMKLIVKVWLETWFGGGRHKKRVDKISDIERKFSK